MKVLRPREAFSNHPWEVRMPWKAHLDGRDLAFVTLTMTLGAGPGGGGSSAVTFSL